MFDSLKKKLSKRGSNPLTQKSAEANQSPTQGGYLAPKNSNPFSAGTPPTRRPSETSSMFFDYMLIKTGGSRSNPFARQNADDPPPTYTASQASSAPISYDPPMAPVTDDDPYAFLRSFDTIFLIDDSGSMAGSRWKEVTGALELIAPICAARDENGVDVWFLNNQRVFTNLRTASAIQETFQTARPYGQTFTGQRLYHILHPYLAEYKKNPKETKPVNIIVITDGEAHDDVAGTLMNVAQKLDKWEAPPWQVGVQFFQIGDDRQASEMLKDLDNNLGRDQGLRDIVDTVPFKDQHNADLSPAGILKVSLLYILTSILAMC